MLWLVFLQGLQSAVNYTLYVAGRDAQSQPNYADPAQLLNVSHSMQFTPLAFLPFLPCQRSMHSVQFTKQLLLVVVDANMCTN